jgi:hypothetical protein
MQPSCWRGNRWAKGSCSRPSQHRCARMVQEGAASTACTARPPSSGRAARLLGAAVGHLPPQDGLLFPLAPLPAAWLRLPNRPPDEWVCIAAPAWAERDGGDNGRRQERDKHEWCVRAAGGVQWSALGLRMRAVGWQGTVPPTGRHRSAGTPRVEHKVTYEQAGRRVTSCPDRHRAGVPAAGHAAARPAKIRIAPVSCHLPPASLPLPRPPCWRDVERMSTLCAVCSCHAVRRVGRQDPNSWALL